MMARPKLRSHELPDWPRLMPVVLAAAYVGASENHFLDEVEAGIWPAPIPNRRPTCWCRNALDLATDGLVGDALEAERNQMLGGLKNG